MILMERARLLIQTAIETGRSMAIVDYFTQPGTLDDLKRRLAKLRPGYSTSVELSTYMELFDLNGHVSADAFSRQYDCDVRFDESGFVRFLKHKSSQSK
jgi:hypothetical protein